MRNRTEFDLHLSANQISRSSVSRIERLGFARDQFANNTRCVAAEYHGTYAGDVQLPNDDLWYTATDILLSDQTFVGHLEEECVSPKYTRIVRGDSNSLPSPLPALQMMDVPAGQHKACDIHMGVNLASPDHVLARLEGVEIVSFDRPIPDGVRRVYTITCATVSDGIKMFDAFCNYFRAVPDAVLKIKLEVISRFLRHPDNVATLPLCTSQDVGRWLGAVGRAGCIRQF